MKADDFWLGLLIVHSSKYINFKFPMIVQTPWFLAFNDALWAFISLTSRQLITDTPQSPRVAGHHQTRRNQTWGGWTFLFRNYLFFHTINSAWHSLQQIYFNRTAVILPLLPVSQEFFVAQHDVQKQAKNALWSLKAVKPSWQIPSKSTAEKWQTYHLTGWCLKLTAFD